MAMSAAAACRQAPAPAEAPRSTTQASPTFNKDIAPILYGNCSTCHRPVDPRANADDPICFAGAPFSLLKYSDARMHAREIARATKNRVMPPWLPEQASNQIGEFANPRRLTEAQIALIEQWVQAGSPEGEPSDRPAVPAWPQGWQLGEPDLVLKMPAAYTLAASGKDVFRNFVLPVSITSRRNT